MKAVVQRVSDASVAVDNEIIAGINLGLVIFVGINYTDSEDDMYKLSKKILELRIFNDNKNKTNFSVRQIKGEILLISQFTLCADTKKGNRPSFIKAMEPNGAKKLFDRFIVSSDFDIKRVELLTALIYLNISPLYEGDYSKFL